MDEGFAAGVARQASLAFFYAGGDPARLLPSEALAEGAEGEAVLLLLLLLVRAVWRRSWRRSRSAPHSLASRALLGSFHA